MHIIAEFITSLGKFGLTDSPISPVPRPDGYYVIFSTHRIRSRCGFDCDTCPLENHNPVKACYATPEHFLPIFGITPESHPEYFI